MRVAALAVALSAGLAALVCGDAAAAQDGSPICRGLVSRESVDRCIGVLDAGTLEGDALFEAGAWIVSAQLTLGDYYGAATYADIFVNIWPDMPYGHAVGCLARAIEGRELNAAEGNCIRAMQLSDAPSMFTIRGVLRLRQERDAEAWTDFNIALQGDPRAQQALYGRGIAAMRLGRMGEGRADMDAAAEIDREMTAADPNALTAAQMYAAWGFGPAQP